MWGWLRKKAEAKRLEPESRWSLSIDGPLIQVIDAKGQAASIAKAELTGINIETNDSGPSGMDCWWLLFAAGDKLACAFPSRCNDRS